MTNNVLKFTPMGPLESVAKALGEMLVGTGHSITTAESCTGGWVSQAITSIPGSSEWFDRGFVSYSNEAKRELLGVRLHALRRHGAVSEKVVCDMALGAVRKSKATFSVAVSGIAGPGGGTDEKPVGTVWFAWAYGKEVESSLMYFSGDRQQIRQGATLIALQGLVTRIPVWLKNEKKTEPEDGEPQTSVQ